jgi:oxygen-independent coproporphyrinogen-3 oxidase
MGLRLSEGINLNIKQNKKAYEFYKEKLKFISIKNNHLVCNNINLLDATLIDLL